MLVAHCDVKQEEQNLGRPLYQWVHVSRSSLTFRPEKLFLSQGLFETDPIFHSRTFLRQKGADLKPYVPGVWWLAKFSAIDMSLAFNFPQEIIKETFQNVHIMSLCQQPNLHPQELGLGVVACKSKNYFIYLLSSLFFFKRSISLTQLDRLLFTVEGRKKKTMLRVPKWKIVVSDGWIWFISYASITFISFTGTYRT